MPATAIAGSPPRLGYVTLTEAARFLGCSVDTVEGLIEAGVLDVYRLPTPHGRGHRRVRVADLDVLLIRDESKRP